MNDNHQYPFDARILPDPETKDRLVTNLNERFSEPRLGIHVSDLVYCLRQSVFRKITPKPNGECELSYYTAGRGHHDLLEGLHGAQREVQRDWEGVQARFDLLDEQVLEIKTSRSSEREPKRHWILQLAFYCVIQNQSTGKLIVLYLYPQRTTKGNPKPSPDMIQTYTVNFPNIEEVRRVLRERRDLLVKALEARNPTLVPGVMYDKDSKWLCKHCQYKSECESQESNNSTETCSATKPKGDENA
jgi:CRISPR/Cas system-associated exonuclease Cas4 (RecB family)